MTELNKETACMGEKSIALFSQAYCEADVIVPDIYPDVAKVLQISTKPSITAITSGKDRVSLDGRADITILYMGEDKGIYSININQPFSHTIDAEGAPEDMYGETEIAIDNTDYTILNTRKLSVKVLMGIDLNLSQDVYAQACTSVPPDKGVEVLSHTINPYKTVCRITEQICIRENLELPPGKPSVEKILKVDVFIRNKEHILSQGKLIIKGTLVVSTVYCSDVDGKIHCAEQEFSFAESLDATGAEPDMKARVKLCINKVFYKRESDMEGDVRIISIECVICAFAKIYCTTHTQLLKDAYCTDYPLVPVKEQATVTTLITENSCQLSAKDVATLPADLPEILQVFSITPRPQLSDTIKEGNKITIKGIIESDILYLSQDDASPLNTYTHLQEFSHSFEIPEGCGNVICDVHTDILHSTYTITLGREIDLRFVLQLDTDVTSSQTVEYITDIEDDRENCYDKRKSYCIKIYFAKECDNLWDIAKKHRVTMDALMEINNLTCDSEIFTGKQLMIPIK